MLASAVNIYKNDRSAHILFCDNIISCVIVLQHGSKTTYISLVDSSGYHRGYSGIFIAEILAKIPRKIVCFSSPKNEPILKNSSKNMQKVILSPSKLFNYYIKIFNSLCGCNNSNSSQIENSDQKKYKCVESWSNFSQKRSYPYNSITDIEMFEDDPKTKMSREFENAEDFFQGLLVRSDFTSGGLIFLNCSNKKAKDTRISHIDCFEANIDDMLAFLRNSDLGTHEKALSSSLEFLSAFKIQLTNSEIESIKVEKKVENDAPVELIPRKK